MSTNSLTDFGDCKRCRGIYFCDAHMESVIFWNAIPISSGRKGYAKGAIIVFIYCVPCETFASRKRGIALVHSSHKSLRRPHLLLRNSLITSTTNSGTLLFSFADSPSPMNEPCVPGRIINRLFVIR
jgi:hypothetical protein